MEVDRDFVWQLSQSWKSAMNEQWHLLYTKEHSFIQSFKLLLSSFYVSDLALREVTIYQDRKDTQLCVIWYDQNIMEVKASCNGRQKERWIDSVWGLWNAKIYKVIFKWHLEKSSKRWPLSWFRKDENTQDAVKVYDVQADSCIVISRGAKSCTMAIIIVLERTCSRNKWGGWRHPFSCLTLTSILS